MIPFCLRLRARILRSSTIGRRPGNIQICCPTASKHEKAPRATLVELLFWRHHPDSDRGLADLQSTALPLGYGAIFYFVVSPRSEASRGNGAGNEIRTRYLHLGKVALCQMSYARILYAPGTEIMLCRGPREAKLRGDWCLRSESNQRHEDFQSSALPTELQRHIRDTAASLGDRDGARTHDLQRDRLAF